MAGAEVVGSLGWFLLAFAAALVLLLAVGDAAAQAGPPAVRLDPFDLALGAALRDVVQAGGLVVLVVVGVMAVKWLLAVVR